MHITPSTSHGSLASSLLPSQTHYHSRTLPHRQCNGTSGDKTSNESSPSGSVAVDSRRRLQPVGSDSIPKAPTDPVRVNGFKRNSMLLDSTGTVAGISSGHSHYHRSGSKGSVKSAASSIEPSHDSALTKDSKYPEMPFV